MKNKNNIIDFNNELTKRNSQQILEELFNKHKKTNECGIYEIKNGKLSNKLRDI